MSVRTSERIAHHEIEPELLSPAPRRLRLTYWSTFTFGVWLFGFSFVAICVFNIAVQSSRMMWLADNGRTALGTVTGCLFIDGTTGACSEQPNRIDQIKFVFPADGSEHNGSIVYNALRDNTPSKPDVPLRIKDSILLRYGTFNGHLAYGVASSLSSRSAGCAMLGSIAVGGVCFICGLRWLLWNARMRRIVCHGLPVIGTVTDKLITDDDGPRYYVTVGFRDDTHEPRQIRERCTPEQWRRLDIGQPITVLTLGASEKASAIYVHIPMKCALPLERT